MATLNQIEASRRNGAKSKGPVTPEGKARVSQNGIRHGIYAQTVVLENEDTALYHSWRNNHLVEWAPATATEHNLVIDIVDARWRLRRLNVLETKALDFEITRMRPEVDEAFERIDEGTRTVLGLNSLLSLNRTWEVIQTAIRSQHRIIDRCTAQLLGKVRRRALDEVADDAIPSVSAQTSVEVAHTNEPSPAPLSSQSDNETNAHAKSEEQTRPEPATRHNAARESESKPGAIRIHTLPCSRTVFDLTLDTRRRARLEAA